MPIQNVPKCLAWNPQPLQILLKFCGFICLGRSARASGEKEFKSFLWHNAIFHLTSLSYHLVTNKQVERFVQALKSLAADHGSLQQKLEQFVLAYNSIAHTISGQSPAMLFIGRHLHSCLDLMKPDLGMHVEKQQFGEASARGCSAPHQPQVGQTVLAHDYRGPTKLCPAIIHHQTGRLSHTSEVSPSTLWHIGQLQGSGVTPAWMTEPTYSGQSPTVQVGNSSNIPI